MQPTTTLQQDLTTAGQRRINLIWEYTQAVIAIMATFDSLLVITLMVIRHEDLNKFPLFLASLEMLIVGFYFSRTNHTAVGGVGAKQSELQYVERR